jgi:hypothetical protein
MAAPQGSSASEARIQDRLRDLPALWRDGVTDDRESGPSNVDFLGHPMTGVGVRREKAALSQWVKAPPGKLLQPEATGATMEVTKWLKPPVKRVTNW